MARKLNEWIRIGNQNYSGAIVCARDAHFMISDSTRSSIAVAPGVISGGCIGDEGDGGGEVVGDGLGTVRADLSRLGDVWEPFNLVNY